MTGMTIADSRLLPQRRTRTFIGIMVALVLAVAVVSVSVGATVLSPAELGATLIGQGRGNHDFLVFTLRLPRVAMAIAVGTAFAVSGALFQTMLRNPLASPDMIGITGGASAAAVSGILFFGMSGLALSFTAFVGALAVAAAIYALSWRAGITGYRFVLVGIGIAFLVTGVIGYLLTRADLRDAQSALVWMVGSLNGVLWIDVAIAGAGLAILLPLVATVASRVRIVQLGDDVATGLGVSVNRTRVVVILVAVALAALGTAAVGPLAFVAFVSAPIARRALRTGRLALIPSALVGALLVMVADLAGQYLLAGTKVPAGLITGAVGAPYLLWLLSRSSRSSGGAA